MDTALVQEILSCVFPKEIIERFDIVRIEKPENHQLRIMLVEKAEPPARAGTHIESKGFAKTTTIYDYPLRDRAVILEIKRRRWRDATTGKSIHVPLALTAPGTSFTKEFGSFLKAAD